jgi:hypothetical protein
MLRRYAPAAGTATWKVTELSGLSMEPTSLAPDVAYPLGLASVPCVYTVASTMEEFSASYEALHGGAAAGLVPPPPGSRTIR